MAASMDADQSAWHISRRWSEFEGEIRAAIMRIAFIGLFYTLQLVHFFGLSEKTEADQFFQRQSTLLCVTWLFISLAVLVALRQRFFPSGLKFVTSGLDLILTSVAAWLGSGPASPIVCIYFLLVAMAGLRFSLSLVWFTTIGAMVGYTILVGSVDKVWFDATHTTPPIEQLVTHAALVGTGVTMGQVVRMTRKGAIEFAARLERKPTSQP